MARETSKGQCLLCNRAFSKVGMARHLQSCGQRAAASHKPGARRERLLLIVVEGRYLPMYWLHLEARASADFYDLDAFLRGIWLECCGHMSAFEIGGRSYSVSPMGHSEEEDMSARLGAVLAPGTAFSHQYDFGSTTDLRLRVAAEWQGAPRREPIRLLARNDPPQIPCGVCGKPAALLCTDCSYEPEGWLCDACARDHECADDMFLPVVNSPRVGVCAYAGEADAAWAPLE